MDNIEREAIEERRAFDKANDYRAASLMSLLANCHRDPKTRAFEPADFLPGGRPDLTEEQLEAKLAAILGGMI